MRWVLITLLTLGCGLAGLPSASAVAGGVITGTVTFHEDDPDRTLEVYRQTEGVWSEDESLETTIADDGGYTVNVPADEPVLLRVSYGERIYGYFYGDGFRPDTATTVAVAAGETLTDIDLAVPAPAYFSGQLLDRSGQPVAGLVYPTANTSGAMLPTVTTPFVVDATGAYSVILPASYADDVWYEDGVLATDPSGNNESWLGGGSGPDPNWYFNPRAGDVETEQDITLPIDSAQSAGPSATPSSSVSRLRATRSPIIRGRTRRGATLHTTSGRYNLRPAAIRYQWLRNGRPIRGAHASAYRLRRADVRKHIRVRVTATRSGTTVRATSSRTATIRRR